MFSSLIYILQLVLALGLESKSFDVYWNIPTYLCKKYVDFSDMPTKYGIIQNSKDHFRGEKIAILYEPGHFPALVKNPSSGGLEVHNGGVPQAGNLSDHLEAFEDVVNKQIKEDFAGVGIIDFEMWRPIYRHNFASLGVYKERSLEVTKKKYPDIKDLKELETLSEKEFESAGKEFMSKTLELAKQLRPKASWGYYAFPYCFNINGAKDGVEDCASRIREENDRLQKWMFDESKIIFPAVYLQTNLDLGNRTKLVSGRVKEAVRVAIQTKANPPPKVLTYIRFVFTDDIEEYLKKEDWQCILPAMIDNGSDGVILWGSSEDVNTKEKCEKFDKYMKDTLGPILKRFKTESESTRGECKQDLQ